MDWTIHLSDVVTLFPPLTETNKTHYPSSTQEPSNCAQWHLDACGIGPSRLEITPWVGEWKLQTWLCFHHPECCLNYWEECRNNQEADTYQTLSIESFYSENIFFFVWDHQDKQQ